MTLQRCHQWAWVDFPAAPQPQSCVSRRVEASMSALRFDSEGDTCSAVISVCTPIRISEFQHHKCLSSASNQKPICLVCLFCLFMRTQRRMYFKAAVCPAPSPCFAFNRISAYLSFERSRPFVVINIVPGISPSFLSNVALSSNTINLPLRPTF